ncbi:unnamed protein product [Cyprideis torosa]|uniref:Uncharacterized protein n=1 Tax=Cyprideis torosa TaxID=163714 RepID=A0A7R8ZLY3_9CRUS|nr:unnamed protein product [Cyprideis torosa]CAG0884677.1 unnamed protein product [Cyprideis torosa]
MTTSSSIFFLTLCVATGSALKYVVNPAFAPDLKSNAKRCYTCFVEEPEDDDPCVSAPADVDIGSPSMLCPREYCVIRRKNYYNESYGVYEFYRGCEEDPVHLNHNETEFLEFENGTKVPMYKVYYRSCHSDLCNRGNGIAPNGNDGIDGGIYGGDNDVVPGLGSGGPPSASSSEFILLCILGMFVTVDYWDHLSRAAILPYS